MGKCAFDTFNKHFFSKKHAMNYFRSILNNTTIGNRLSDEAEADFRALMLFHPNYKNKAKGGIKYIYVDMHRSCPSRCFNIRYKDGSSDDISFYKIIKAI